MQLSRLRTVIRAGEEAVCKCDASAAAQAAADAPAILNAANEVAVQAFLDQRIGFTQIAQVVGETLSGLSLTEPESLDAVQESDSKARAFSTAYIAEIES